MTVVAFVNETLSSITQYYRTVDNARDSLYGKHQMRESDLTLERVYTMLAEFLIELTLHEEQDKIAQIVTGSSSTVKHSMYDDYISASKGKASTKGKGKKSDGKNGKSRWRPPCDDYWKPGGCSQGHHCPHYHPRKQPGRCAICGSTRHSTSQCNRPVKPKAKNVEWEMSSGKSQPGPMRMTSNGSQRSMRRLRARKEKGRDPSLKGSPRARMHRDQLPRGHHGLHRLKETDPNPPPSMKHAPA